VAEPLYLPTPLDWNRWLADNPEASEIWLLFHKKSSGVPSLTWEQAVVEALAHGWIDGVKKTASDTTWIQRFTPRKPGSAWSRKNIAHAERLIAEGRMTPAGMRQVELARANGRWDSAYSGGKGAELPADFLAAVNADPAAVAGLAKLDSRNRFAIYYRLTTVKRAETRARKVADYVALLAAGGRLF
jgi:uncharacterized protein YdeI (YjbR/CyaY-like superfamily)